MNRSAYNATVAETSDIRQTISHAKHTARLWAKILACIGLAAAASAYVDGMTIELVIIAGLCCGVSAVLGIMNWN
jgi:hypothetical protein